MEKEEGKIGCLDLPLLKKLIIFDMLEHFLSSFKHNHGHILGYLQ